LFSRSAKSIAHTHISHDRANKEPTMLIVLIPAAIAFVAWTAWSLRDIVTSVPRCNDDFGGC
jgi:hypothetical protein